MRSLLINDSPDADFWKAYSDLWHNSNERSPFQAPEILQYFSRVQQYNIAAVEFLKGGKLAGCIIFKKERDIYSFLSDLKTDANFFVLHRECSRDDLNFFFSSFLEKVEELDWAIMLNNVPSWANYINLFESCISKSNLFGQNIPYSVCPTIATDSTESLLKTVTHSHKYRHSCNRLRNQLNAVFEVLTDDTDLEVWVKEFTSAHIKRWENTSTPSSFRNKDRQIFFGNCLKAWSKNNILVRFAVKVQDQRIGFVVGLREGNSLIHHSTTFHPDFKKFSPANALVKTMAEWMAEHNLVILDFGDGDEKYKYFFANEERRLNRIMISRRSKFSFIFKMKLIKVIRKNSRTYNFYRSKLKKYLAR